MSDEGDESERRRARRRLRRDLHAAQEPVYIDEGDLFESVLLLGETGGRLRYLQPLALALIASLHREGEAVQAIHALDFGDYAMAVSLFKRAWRLNGSAMVNDDAVSRHRHVLAWREDALPRLFDLREIWLRVIAECREELDRLVDDES